MSGGLFTATPFGLILMPALITRHSPPRYFHPHFTHISERRRQNNLDLCEPIKEGHFSDVLDRKRNASY